MQFTFAFLLVLFFSIPSFAQDAVETEEDVETELEESVIEEEAEPVTAAERAARQNLRGEPLDSLSKKELKKRGFIFQDEGANRDNTTAVVLALTAGLGLHGVGHFYLGDTSTGLVLAGAELLSILMMGGAGLAYFVTDGSTKANSIIAPIFDSGLALFVFSYLADVAGTVAGPENAFPDSTPGNEPITLSTMYGFTASRGSPVRHALSAEVEADFRFVTGYALTIQDLFLETAVYRGGAGFRPFRLRDSDSEILLKGNAELINHSGRGPFGRTGVDGRLVGTLDLGDLFSQLRGFSLTIEGGYGNRWWSFANENNELEVQTQKRYAPFDFRASAWLSKKLWISGGYGTPHNPFVASVSRILGVSHLEIRFRTSSIVDLRVRGELGDGFSSWIGAGISPF